MFEIESWARSSGPRVHLLYDSSLRIAKEIQLHMWISMLQRIAEVAGGRVTGGIDIDTRRVQEQALARARAAPRGAPRPAAQLRPGRSAPGVRRMAHRRLLRGPAARAARAAVDGGSFRVAQTLLRDYQVADPRMVRAYYDHGAPLEGRDMLLELRFLVFRDLRRLSSKSGHRRTARRSPAGRVRSGAGRTRPWRATSSRARCLGRSGSGWIPAKFSSACTPTRGWLVPGTRSRPSASGCSANASAAGT